MSELSLRKSIIKYSKLLNQTNLTPLRSGNISIRFKDGFLILTAMISLFFKKRN